MVIPQGLQGKNKKEKQKKTINILLHLLYLKVKHKSYEEKKNPMTLIKTVKEHSSWKDDQHIISFTS